MSAAPAVSVSQQTARQIVPPSPETAPNRDDKELSALTAVRLVTRQQQQEAADMHSIIYLVGLVVIVLAIINFVL